ncbi:MAG: YdiU family protein, partial [Cyanobacteria bacterium Co-bin8]|nr:YdiU family protein [Cyanobacteria bacterium Co-bin8]
AFMDKYDPRFTAAYFDYSGRYSYANQPGICQWNLQALQKPLALVMPQAEMETALGHFRDRYSAAYQQRMLKKLGFEQLNQALTKSLLSQTLKLFDGVEVGYHDFFLVLTQQFSPEWRTDPNQIFGATLQASDAAAAELLEQWRQIYHRCLNELPQEAMPEVARCLQQTNPETVLLRPEIEAVWEPITVEDNWQPFYDLVQRVQNPFIQA